MLRTLLGLAAALALALPAAAATLTVTPATLKTVLAAAQGGDVVELAPGDYARFDLRGLPAYGSAVVIRPADPANPARFTGGLTLRQASNLTFDGLVFDISDATVSYANAVRIYGGRDLAFVGSTFRGRPVTDAAGAVTDRWGYAINASDTAGLTVRGGKAATLKRGMVFTRVVGLTVEGNDLSDIGTDAVDLDAVSGGKVIANWLRDFHPIGEDHPDGIQLYGAAKDVLVADNFVDAPGQLPQGVFARESSVRMSGLSFERNLVVSAAWNGVYAENVDGLRITGNHLLFAAAPGGSSSKSWLRVVGSNGEVRGNAAMAFIWSNETTVKADNVTIPAATTAQIDAARAAWLAKWRGPATDPRDAQLAELSAQVEALTAQLAEAEFRLQAAKASLASAELALAATAAERDALKAVAEQAQADLAAARLRAAALSEALSQISAIAAASR